MSSSAKISTSDNNVTSYVLNIIKPNTVKDIVSIMIIIILLYFCYEYNCTSKKQKKIINKLENILKTFVNTNNNCKDKIELSNNVKKYFKSVDMKISADNNINKFLNGETIPDDNIDEDAF